MPARIPVARSMASWHVIRRGCLWFLGAVLILGAGASTQASEDLDAWRQKAQTLRLAAEGDARAAYEQALQWRKDAPKTLTAADHASIMAVMATIEDLLGEYDLAERYTKEALTLAEISGDPRVLGEASLCHANNLINSDKADESHAAAMQALKAFSQSRCTDRIVEARILLSRTQPTIDEFQSLHLAEKEAGELGDPRLSAMVHSEFAWAHFRAERYSEALAHARDALPLARQCGSKLSEASALQCLAATIGTGGDRPTAETHFRRAVAVLREAHITSLLAVALKNLSINLRNQGKFEESLKVIEESHALTLPTQVKIDEQDFLALRAWLRLSQGDPAAAMPDAEQSYTLAQELKAPDLIADSASKLAEACAGIGDYKRAYQLTKVAAEAASKNEGEHTKIRIAELELSYATERKQREIEKLAENNRRQTADLQQQSLRQKYLLYIFSGGLLGTLIVIILFVRERHARMRVIQLNERLRATSLALENSSRLKTAVIDGTNYGIIVCSPDLKTLLIFNSGAERILGYDRRELIGQQPLSVFCSTQSPSASPASELASGPWLRSLDDLFTPHVQAGNSDEREWLFRRKDGTGVPVLLIVTSTRGPDGGVGSYVLFLYDLTERKAAESTLHEANERLRLTFDYAGIGMCMVTLDGKTQRVNRRLCKMLGYSEADLLGMTFAQVIHPDDLPGEQRHLKALLVGRVPVAHRDLRLLRHDGSELWVRRTAVILRDAAGKPLCITAQIEDITDRRRFEQETNAARDRALELAQTKSQFLANMSHEIRTPMNGIIGLADLLEKTPLNENQQEMVRLLQDSADSLLAVINDILDFSKIEAGRLEVESIPFNPAILIEDMTKLMLHKAHKKGLSLECELAPECRSVGLGDPMRLRQILGNLIGNAVKFTLKGGISVHAGPSPRFTNGLRIEVRDTGIGIPEERQAELFKPFIQADASHSRKFGGTGLGLAICQQLVGLMHGDIGFTSRAGAGSTFWIEIPIASPHFTSSPFGTVAREALPGPTVKKGLRLLVAEDNPTNRLVLERILAGLSIGCDFAENGHAALRLLRANAYDAVLMDCQMPELDGFETTRLIRAGEATPEKAKIPIIALTAYAMPADRTRCLAAGMNGYVAKPIKEATLLEALLLCGLSEESASPTPACPAPASTEFSSQDPGICDQAQLDLLLMLKTADGAPLWPQILALLYEETPRRLKDLSGMLQARDAKKIGQTTHTLSSSAANVGAEPLRKVARELGEAAAGQAWDKAAGLLDILEQEWVRLHAYLEKVTKGRLA